MTSEEKRFCDARSSCLGCPFVDEGFYIECTLMCGSHNDENDSKGEETD